MPKIISIAQHRFIVATKTSLDLLNLFIFDHMLPVWNVVVGQKIRPTTAESFVLRCIYPAGKDHTKYNTFVLFP